MYIVPCLLISGVALGGIVSLIVTGYLCDSSFLGGWPSPFYILGTVTMATGSLKGRDAKCDTHVHVPLTWFYLVTKIG